jgi:hypothetical protein
LVVLLAERLVALQVVVVQAVLEAEEDQLAAVEALHCRSFSERNELDSPLGLLSRRVR